ncbi:MAG: SCP2 sterol-binding domain-containing protein [Myxococcota bacterium]
MEKQVTQTFEEVSKRLTAEKAHRINASYLFRIGQQEWSVDLTQSSNWIQQGNTLPHPQCTITVENPQDWILLVEDKLNPTMAFMQGKIRVTGQISLALKLQTLLSN